MRYFALILASVFSITGCSYDYQIVAVERSGAIVFEPAKETGSGCFFDFSVRDPKGTVMWRVTAGKYLPPPCDSKFPIVYGVKPEGMAEEVKPLSLQAGITYRAVGWDGDNYTGTFRFKRGILVENMPKRR
jgi:hypothetical protein